MNKEKLNLWNREFELFISYSCYPGEEVTEIQTDAAKEFCEDTSEMQLELNKKINKFNKLHIQK